MNRYAISILLTLISVSTYVYFIDPMYKTTQVGLADEKVLQGFLTDAKTAKSKLDSIVSDYENVTPADEKKLETLLPETIDNLRFIIDVNALAEKHLLKIQSPASSQQLPSTDETKPPYIAHKLTFSVTATYSGIHDLLKDLEKTLQLRDITRVSFASPETSAIDTANSDPLTVITKYDIDLTSYSMK